MLAQGIAEYGGASALAAMIQRASVAVEGAIQGVDTKLALVVLVVVIFLIFRRK